jgi:hypothetical protein
MTSSAVLPRSFCAWRSRIRLTISTARTLGAFIRRHFPRREDVEHPEGILQVELHRRGVATSSYLRSLHGDALFEFFEPVQDDLDGLSRSGCE